MVPRKMCEHPHRVPEVGCMACVTLCPSGVKYDQMIEAVRPQIERNWERSRADRLFRTMIFDLFPYPARLRPAAFFGTLFSASEFGACSRPPV